MQDAIEKRAAVNTVIDQWIGCLMISATLGAIHTIGLAIEFFFFLLVCALPKKRLASATARYESCRFELR